MAEVRFTEDGMRGLDVMDGKENVRFNPGDIKEVSDELAKSLVADFPKDFEKAEKGDAAKQEKERAKAAEPKEEKKEEKKDEKKKGSKKK